MGQVGKLYTVDRGESLGSIAAQMGATVAAVAPHTYTAALGSMRRHLIELVPITWAAPAAARTRHLLPPRCTRTLHGAWHCGGCNRARVRDACLTASLWGQVRALNWDLASQHALRALSPGVAVCVFPDTCGD